MGNYLIYGLNAFVVTALLITWLRPVAGRIGLLDRPDARKLHDGAIPVCGGIAMFAAILVSNAGLGFAVGLPLLGALCLGVIVVVGIIDDRTQLPTLPRLVVQTGAATALVIFGLDGVVNLHSILPAGLGEVALLVAPAVSVLLIVGTINAVNMMDGVDGLAGGYLTLSFFWLALIAQQAGRPAITVEALVLMSAVLGFLVYNLRHPWRGRAAVFMGDAGSTMLGAAIAYLLLSLASGPAGLSLPVLLWLIIVPVTDTLLVVVTRLAAGRSPFQPDRRHLHHLLQDSGLTPARTTLLLSGISALYGGIAYAGVLLHANDVLMTLALGLPIGLHLGFVLSATRPARTAAGARPLATKSFGDQTAGKA